MLIEDVACPLCGNMGTMDDFEYIAPDDDDEGEWRFEDTPRGFVMVDTEPPRTTVGLYCLLCRRIFDYDNLIQFRHDGGKVQRELF